LTQNNKLVSGRLINNLLVAWKGLSIPFVGKRLELSPYLHENELAPLSEKISACLESRGGQASARARAAELGNAYVGMNDEGRRKYLQLLVEKFGLDHTAIRRTAEALFSDLDPTRRNEIETELRRQLTPPYLTLLTQFNALPQGVKFLVDMRNDLISFRREYPELEPMNQLLQEQLSSWFDIGFLDLRRIDWNAPASLLEKLIKYEAVHRIESWTDLRHRLAENRRCFAFFHPSMPDEPLIFVWVALVSELSDNVDELLDPIPGLSNWLENDWLQNSDEEPLLNEEDSEALAAATDLSFEKLLTTRDWLEDEKVCAALKRPLCVLAARYITQQKRGNRALDAVAHFHLSNGAIVERINWLADTSERGKTQSYTLMVNYLYDLDRIESNHEDYIGNGIVVQSREVNQLNGNG